MRMPTLAVSMAMVVMLVGCGLFSDGQKAAEGEGAMTPTMPGTPPALAVSTLPRLDSPTSPEPRVVKCEDEALPAEPGTPSGAVAQSSPIYPGPSSLEERILESPVIARVQLDSVSSAVECGPTYRGSEPIAVLEFRFSVLEYLKGTGASNIVALWNSGQLFDTRQEAEAKLPAIAAARDTRWGFREAILFLQHSKTYLPSTQEPGRFYLSGEHYFGNTLDDYYSIASPYNRLWLPAQPGGDQQRFLLDVPPATGSAPTITLGEMKARIATVTAKVDASDGSEEYRECVVESYFLERMHRHLRETRPERLYTGANISPPHIHQISSGLAGGSVVYELPEESDITPDVPIQVWLDGGHAGFFEAVTPSRDFRVSTTRPLIENDYRFHFNYGGPFYSLCDGYTIRYEWTVTVNAPEGTLHEAFFDPVTAGNAVAADSAYGVLKPASFADASGTSATIHRIAWEPNDGESGKVMMWLTPRLGIADHIVDFIALDGSVSLSLNVANATVDAASGVLSWAVMSQPWRTAIS